MISIRATVKLLNKGKPHLSPFCPITFDLVIPTLGVGHASPLFLYRCSSELRSCRNLHEPAVISVYVPATVYGHYPSPGSRPSLDLEILSDRLDRGSSRRRRGFERKHDVTGSAAQIEICKEPHELFIDVTFTCSCVPVCNSRRCIFYLNISYQADLQGQIRSFLTIPLARSPIANRCPPDQ